MGDRRVPAAHAILLVMPGGLREAFDWWMGAASRSHEAPQIPGATAAPPPTPALASIRNHRLTLALQGRGVEFGPRLRPEGSFRVEEREVLAVAI